MLRWKIVEGFSEREEKLFVRHSDFPLSADAGEREKEENLFFPFRMIHKNTADDDDAESG